MGLRACGFTLVELVVAMMVLSIAVLGVYTASSEMSRRSADPILRTQALSIAQSTLAELQSKEVTSLANCPPVPESGDRAHYSHLCHYFPWTDSVVKNQFDSVLPQFSQYSVDVKIAPSDKLGPVGNTVSDETSFLITVTVDHVANLAEGALAKLSVYRVRQ